MIQSLISTTHKLDKAIKPVVCLHVNVHIQHSHTNVCTCTVYMYGTEQVTPAKLGTAHKLDHFALII